MRSSVSSMESMMPSPSRSAVSSSVPASNHARIAGRGDVRATMACMMRLAWRCSTVPDIVRHQNDPDIAPAKPNVSGWSHVIENADRPPSEAPRNPVRAGTGATPTSRTAAGSA
ncbi:MAG TPA: hypothetical protein VKE22_18695 [Haliangiales bacterium]|nr:hypothetical protein [Haliangiales bacterium]